MPGLRARPAWIDSGWSPWKVTFTGGSPVTSTSKRSPSGPKRQAGSRSASPISQLTRAVITGSPRTVPCQLKRCAATRPGAIFPIGESIGAVATAISCVVRFSASSAKPSASASRSTDCRKPAPSSFAIGLAFACSGVLPNSITSEITAGAP
jgi:hypothetical protein